MDSSSSSSVPGSPGVGPLPGGLGEIDPEWAQYVAQVDRETILRADDWEPPEHEQAAALPRFWQDGAADRLPPGPPLSALTEQAISDLGCLSDDELVGVLLAARRQAVREQYKQVLVTAEFGRRRQAAFADAAARGVPAAWRPGGFPGEELAIELVTTRADAGHRIDDAIDLAGRLPATLAGMAAGAIDEDRAGLIALCTRSLTDADAAHADQVLAHAAPGLRVEQLARKAAALEMKLNPAGAAARKEHARRQAQRVEARREASGNASLAGREMSTADALASKACIDALATRLRDSGQVPGTLDQLRVLAFTDLTQGRNPLGRITGPASEPPAPGSPGPGCQPSPGRDPGPGPANPPAPHPAPLPALVNLIIPAGTLLGWDTAPAQAGPWGLLDRDDTKTAGGAAARHPRTRWCVTLTAPDGTAIAHACARGPRPRLLDDLQPHPPPDQLTELIRRLSLTFTPVTRDPADHDPAEPGHAPSRALRHLVRARTATCDAPGCHAPAVNADLDHTVPWPDGPTSQANLAPRCRTHHRAKQAPDWNVHQPAPGITRWTLPSGRTHTTTPTSYDT